MRYGFLLVIALIVSVGNIFLTATASTLEGTTKTILTLTAAGLNFLGLVFTLIQKFWAEPAAVEKGAQMAVAAAVPPPVPDGSREVEETFDRLKRLNKDGWGIQLTLPTPTPTSPAD